MELSIYDRIKKFNEDWNNLPKKTLVVACVLLCVFLFSQILKYIAPFVVALILALLINPLVRLLSLKIGKLRIPRALATLISMILVFGLLILIVVLITSRGIVELKNLIVSLPAYISSLLDFINIKLDELFAWLDQRVDIISPESIVIVRDYLTQIGRTLTGTAGTLANRVARGAFNTAISIPQIVLFIVLTFMGTFYMSSDKDRIFNYFYSLLPKRATNVLGAMKRGMFRAIFGQLRAQVFLTLIMFTELLIGFTLMRIPYALLLAVFIALMDALPVIGSGLFLIPWFIYGFLTGNMTIGVGMLLLYGTTLVVRQLMEPRIVGAQLGIYPLATMISMYAGFVLIGFLGMLLGPITFMLCRVAVYAVCEPPPDQDIELTSKASEIREETVNVFKKHLRKKKKEEDKPKEE